VQKKREEKRVGRRRERYGGAEAELQWLSDVKKEEKKCGRKKERTM
jgi:hypothetical protein